MRDLVADHGTERAEIHSGIRIRRVERRLQECSRDLDAVAVRRIGRVDDRRQRGARIHKAVFRDRLAELRQVAPRVELVQPEHVAVQYPAEFHGRLGEFRRQVRLCAAQQIPLQQHLDVDQRQIAENGIALTHVAVVEDVDVVTDRQSHCLVERVEVEVRDQCFQRVVGHRLEAQRGIALPAPA